jgi:predicted double-glycine peptidase
MKKSSLVILLVILLISLPVTGCQGDSGSKESIPVTNKGDEADADSGIVDEEVFEVSFEHYYPASLDLKEQLPTALIELPLVRQSTRYTCGVACAQSILRYTGYDFDVREDNLSSALGANDEDGTNYRKIVELLNTKSHYSDSTQDGNENRIIAEPKFELTIDELCAYLDQGKPVICAIQAWSYLTISEYKLEYDSGHYVIAIGYDAENIYFMDPSTSGNYAYIPKTEFAARWHDVDGESPAEQFGIVITIESDYHKDLAYKIE